MPQGRRGSLPRAPGPRAALPPGAQAVLAGFTPNACLPTEKGITGEPNLAAAASIEIYRYCYDPRSLLEHNRLITTVRGAYA